MSERSTDRGSALHDDERRTIDAFVVPSRRARVHALGASPRAREKVVDSLLRGLRDFDPRWLEPIAPGQFPETIEAMLRRRGAPAKCRVVGSSLDGTEVPLREALEHVNGSLTPALLICVPGQLAYLETESQDERYVLDRGRSVRGS